MFSYCFPFHDTSYSALKNCTNSPWYTLKGGMWFVLQNIMWTIVLKVSEKWLQIPPSFLLGTCQIICHFKKSTLITTHSLLWDHAFHTVTNEWLAGSIDKSWIWWVLYSRLTVWLRKICLLFPTHNLMFGFLLGLVFFVYTREHRFFFLLILLITMALPNDAELFRNWSWGFF